MANILITGLTGFLGSAIAEEFSVRGHQVLGLKRKNSDLWRCVDFADNIIWVNVDDDYWRDEVLKFAPVFFIHSAWGGVSAKDRQNWSVQLKNLYFLIELLELASEVKAKKFIGFGSQAEYGLFSGKIDERYPLKPNNSYGLSKMLAMQTIKCFAEQNNLNWIWMRLFSFFGEKEDANWFIPTVINNLINNSAMDMTPGDQQYAYMYINDLAKIVVDVTFAEIESGDYNVSSEKSYSLRTIVDKILKLIGPQVSSQINFGAIPYRENQPMLIAGNTDKLSKKIGHLKESDFDENLKKVINYIKGY